MRRLSPLPLLDHLGDGLFDHGAKPGEGLAPPVAQLFDPCLYQLSWRLVVLRRALLHGVDVAPLRLCRPILRAAFVGAHASRGSRCSSSSTRAKPLFAPSSTPYCIVVSRSSVVAKRIVCVSFVRSPRSSNSSVCRWFWNDCTRRAGGSTSRNSPSTTPKAVWNR